MRGSGLFFFCAFAANHVPAGSVAPVIETVVLVESGRQNYRWSSVCADRAQEEACHPVMLLKSTNVTKAVVSCPVTTGMVFVAALLVKTDGLQAGTTELHFEDDDLTIMNLLGTEVSTLCANNTHQPGEVLLRRTALLQPAPAALVGLGLSKATTLPLLGVYRGPNPTGRILVVQNPYTNLPLVLKGSSRACSLRLQPYLGAYEDWDDGEASMSKSGRVWRQFVMHENATLQDIYDSKTVEHLASSFQSPVDRFYFKTVYTAEGIDDLVDKLTALLPAPGKEKSDTEEWVPGRCQMVFQRVIRISGDSLRDFCSNDQEKPDMYGAALQLAEEELPSKHLNSVATRIRAFIIRDAPPNLQRFSYAVLPPVNATSRICYRAKGVTQLGANLPALPFGSNGVVLQLPDFVISKTSPRIGLFLQDDKVKFIKPSTSEVRLPNFMEALVEYEVVI